MYYTTTLTTILCFALTACVEPEVPVQKVDAGVIEYTRMKSGQNRFDVGVHPSRKFARIVPITGKATVTEVLLESMAAEVSGCPASLKHGKLIQTVPNYTPTIAFPLTYPVNVDLNCG